MAINDGRTPHDPRGTRPTHDPLVDPAPGATDPYAPRPGEPYGEAYRDDMAAARNAETTRPGRSNASWAWALAAIVVLAAVLAFFFAGNAQDPTVPQTGAIEQPTDPNATGAVGGANVQGGGETGATGTTGGPATVPTELDSPTAGPVTPAPGPASPAPTTPAQ